MYVYVCLMLPAEYYVGTHYTGTHTLLHANAGERARERERGNEIMSFAFVSVPVTGMGALMKEGTVWVG